MALLGNLADLGKMKTKTSLFQGRGLRALKRAPFRCQASRSWVDFVAMDQVKATIAIRKAVCLATPFLVGRV
jgi:hypothetical protein